MMHSWSLCKDARILTVPDCFQISERLGSKLSLQFCLAAGLASFLRMFKHIVLVRLGQDELSPLFDDFEASVQCSLVVFLGAVSAVCEAAVL